MDRFEGLKRWAKRLKTELHALYLAYGDTRVPFHARVFAAVVVAYAFSPIDLIPDAIPVLGYLDDLILVPLGIALAIHMIPPASWRSADPKPAKPRPKLAPEAPPWPWPSWASGCCWPRWGST